MNANENSTLNRSELSDVYIASADYRSIANGNWSDTSKWQVNDGVSWVPALSYPGELGNVRDVVIRHAITITVNPRHSIHDLTIDAAKSLDDGGHSLSLRGDFRNNGTATLTGTLTFTGSEDQGVACTDNFGSVIISKIGTVVVESGLTLSGSLTVTAGILDATGDFILTVNGVTLVNGGILSLTNDLTATYYSLFIGNFTLSSGTLNAGNRDLGFGGNFVKSGGTFNAGSSSLVFGESTAQSITSNADMTIANVRHWSSSVSGTRTLTFIGTGGTRTFTVTSEFERGSRSQGINLTSAVIAYQAGATLIYSQSTAMTIAANEWPVSGGPDNVTNKGSGNLTLPFSRTIPVTGTFLLNQTGNSFIISSLMVLTINGTFQRNALGTITVIGTLTYGEDSLLHFVDGAANITIGAEWPVSGPANIEVDNSGFRVEFSPLAAGVARTITKDVTVGTGAVLSLTGNTAGILTIGGTLTLEGTGSIDPGTTVIGG